MLHIIQNGQGGGGGGRGGGGRAHINSMGARIRSRLLRIKSQNVETVGAYKLDFGLYLMLK